MIPALGKGSSVFRKGLNRSMRWVRDINGHHLGFGKEKPVLRHWEYRTTLHRKRSTYKMQPGGDADLPPGLKRASTGSDPSPLNPQNMNAHATAAAGIQGAIVTSAWCCHQSLNGLRAAGRC